MKITNPEFNFEDGAEYTDASETEHFFCLGGDLFTLDDRGAQLELTEKYSIKRLLDIHFYPYKKVYTLDQAIQKAREGRKFVIDEIEAKLSYNYEINETKIYFLGNVVTAEFFLMAVNGEWRELYE